MASSGDVGIEVTDIVQKKCVVTDRLQKREEERLLQIQQRKAIKEETNISRETTQYFTVHLTKLREEVETGLNDYCAEKHGPAAAYLDNLLLQVQQLQKFITDSTHFLSAYEVQRAQTMVSKLKQSVEQMKTELAPKKKFAFKSEKKKVAPPIETAVNDRQLTTIESPLGIVKEQLPKITLESNEWGFLNRTNQTLSMLQSEIDGKDVVLMSLAGCRVTLQGAPSTVHMSTLRNCVILCGPTSGSIFIDDCRNCTFVVACHQLRTHRTSESSFYLHVTSRAIIEDCTEVTFAPYSWVYPTLDDDFRRAGLDRQRNNWNSVDDFNWLSSDSRSPNWTVMDDSSRDTFIDDVSGVIKDA